MGTHPETHSALKSVGVMDTGTFIRVTLHGLFLFGMVRVEEPPPLWFYQELL